MISVPIFLLVIGASIFHAVWNFFARKVKGNVGVVWLGFIFGDILVGPISIYFLVKDIQNHVDLRDGLIYGFWSGVIHAFYLLALAFAYKEGDISLVYPIARGSGVAGTALISSLALKEKISLLGWIGISSVVGGIFLLGLHMLDKYFDKIVDCIKARIPKKKQYVQVETESVPKEVQLDSIEQENLPQNNIIVENEPTSVPAAQKAILLALSVGVTICSYSIVDAKGVSKMNPIAYMFMIELISGLLVTPYVLWKRRDGILIEKMCFEIKECKESIKNLKKYIAFIGPASFASYIAILYAFQKANASYVVAMREVSVVIGCILGFVFLKEKFTLRKALGILFIAVGLVLVKLA